MNLILTITSYKGSAPAYPITHQLDRGTMTLGRLDSNDWVLPDDEKYLSSKHAQITKTRDGFQVKDISSNGVFVNNTTRPLGKGNQVILKNNDVIYIGEYVISVLVQNAALITTPPLPVSSRNTAVDNDPFADLGNSPLKELGNQQNDGLTEWEKSLHSERPTMEIIVDKNNSSVQAPAEVAEDNSAELHDAFVKPNAATQKRQDPGAALANELPEDWFENEPPAVPENLNTPDKQAFAVPNKEQLQPREEDNPTEQLQVPNIPTPAAATSPATEKVPTETIKMEVANSAQAPEQLPRDYQLAMKMFLKSAGVEDSIDADEIGPETFALVGQLFKASIDGIREIILARSKLKNEMRLDVTTIRSTGNNPIKFSLSTEDAITRLLASQKQGFMHPATAVEEVVDDLKAHQIAMLAGMQTALRSILEKFEPALLEQRLQKQNPLSAKVPLQKQAKLWKLFDELYHDIQVEATEDFNHLFGQAFGKAYEKQIWKLKTEKANSDKKGAP